MLPLLAGTVGLLPCIGRCVASGASIYVIGTAHTPCRSADEVRGLIAKVRPDAVVLELDAERWEQLNERRLGLEQGGALAYGAEFVAAADAADACGATIVLGDARIRDIAAALRSPEPGSARRLVRAWRLALGRGADVAARRVAVNVPAALLADPAKLAPLTAASLWTTALLLAAAYAPRPPPAWGLGSLLDVSAGPIVDALAQAAELAVAIAAAARVADVLLLSRDEVLAASALRAARLVRASRSGELLRRTFDFASGAAGIAAAEATPADAGEEPVFTHKTPLRAGEERTLNLFEPRWLAMMDELAGADLGDWDAPSTADLLRGKRLVSATCANRVYTQRAGGRRGADLLLSPRARFARVVSAEEKVRPVSKARALRVTIVGEEEV